MQHAFAFLTLRRHAIRWQCHQRLLLCLVFMLSACASPTPNHRAPLSATMPGHQLHGILADMRTLQPLNLRMLVANMRDIQVVFVGEEHYHPDIQAFELRLLQTLTQQRPQRIALAMEFLERDDQQTVDAYVNKRIDRATFHKRLKASPSFRRYYTPLLRYARRTGVPVLAMNAPRQIARQVARTGLRQTLQELSTAERAHLPTSFPAVPDQYRQYFLEAVASHHPVQGKRATHLTESSFLKDMTMADTLATFLQNHPDFTVLAIAGRFHVDHGIAVPTLLAEQHANVTMRRITAMTVTADKAVNLSELKREAIADYIRFFPPNATHDTAGLDSLTAQGTGTHWQEKTKVGGNR